MVEREEAILDRGLLIALVQAQVANSEWYKQAITSACTRYKRVLFEPVAMSALIHQVYEIRGLEQRLVALSDAGSLATPEEAKLIEAGLQSAGVDPRMIHEQQRYARRIGAAAPGGDPLAYLVRLLLLSRRFDADIILWHERLDLLRTFLEVAGISTATHSIGDELQLVTSDPCPFPFLATAQKSVPKPFQLVTFREPDHRSSQHRTRLRAGQTGAPGVARSSLKRDLVFLSYSHRDHRWLKRFEPHLKLLIRNGSIQAWSDKDIEAGDKWGDEIKSALSRARVAVLLVSPAFLASDYIRNEEIPSLLEAADRGELRILWVALSASLYDRTPIARFQATNDPARPLDSMRPAEVNRVVVDICRKIQRAFDGEGLSEK